MAVTIKHTFTNPVEDDPAFGGVKPSHWNADHTVEGLGTAAEADSSDFATATQGGKADTAVQPGDLGTAAALDVGTSDGDVVQVQTGGKLPALDGSQLTNLPAGSGAVDSVNGLTGTVVLDPDDLDDSATTNKFTTASDISKLAGVEASADVTDAGNVGSAIHGASGKTTPVDADTVALIDSAASNVLKKLTWANLKATLKTYFDTLYQAAGSYITASSTDTLTNKTFDAAGTGTPFKHRHVHVRGERDRHGQHAGGRQRHASRARRRSRSTLTTIPVVAAGFRRAPSSPLRAPARPRAACSVMGRTSVVRPRPISTRLSGISMETVTAPQPSTSPTSVAVLRPAKTTWAGRPPAGSPIPARAIPASMVHLSGRLAVWIATSSLSRSLRPIPIPRRVPPLAPEAATG